MVPSIACPIDCPIARYQVTLLYVMRLQVASCQLVTHDHSRFLNSATPISPLIRVNLQYRRPPIFMDIIQSVIAFNM